MKCPRCQFENPAETNYCGRCGMPLFRSAEEAAAPTMTMETPLYSLERGTTIAGRYEVIEEVGKGGMGRVYKVFDKKIKGTIALKLLRPEIVSDHRTIERFNNELKFARQIGHPNVCRMYDLGQEGQTHFITMEFVAGEDLKAFIRRAGHLTEPKAITIARQVADGLTEAHRLGVLHRDLKPQNVMIDRDGNAKIMDFGIARSLHAAGVTGPGAMIGTPEYMSPEQAEAGQVDQRSDLYSLGVILYEMVTGQVPFAGETPLSVALKHRVEEPRDPRKVNPLISEELSLLILRTLEKDKERRYQNAAELRAELERLEKGFPTAERLVPKKKIAAAEPGPRRTTAWKMAASAVILIAVLIAAWTLGRRILREEGKPAGRDARHFVRAEPPAVPDSKTPRELEKTALGEPGEKARESADETKILGPILRGAMRFMKPEDLVEVEKVMEKAKQLLPPDSPYLAMWNEARGKFEESIKHKQEGKISESERSYKEGQNRMADLLAVVEAKERADAAREEMRSSRSKAEATLHSREDNLLFRVAAAKERDATEAYAKEDFTGALALFKILARVFALSPRAGSDEEAIHSLRDYLLELKAEAMSVGASRLDAWYVREAQQEEASAETLRMKKEYSAAAETLVRAAFLYEKAKAKAAQTAPPK